MQTGDRIEMMERLDALQQQLILGSAMIGKFRSQLYKS